MTTAIPPYLMASAVSAYEMMCSKVYGGNYGNNVSIDPRWLGDAGFAEFANWYVKFNPTYTAVVSKDLLGPTSVFSPDTAVVVPSRFLNWFHKAVMRYQLYSFNGAHTAVFQSPGGKVNPPLFGTPEAAANWWRESMHKVIEKQRPGIRGLDAVDKRIIPRLYEIVDQVVDGKEPIQYWTRRELRYK